MYPDNGFLIAYQLGTPASQQHPLSAAIPFRERLAVSRNLSPGEVAGGSVMPKALPHTPALSRVILTWILKLMSELA